MLLIGFAGIGVAAYRRKRVLFSAYTRSSCASRLACGSREQTVVTKQLSKAGLASRGSHLDKVPGFVAFHLKDPKAQGHTHLE